MEVGAPRKLTIRVVDVECEPPRQGEYSAEYLKCVEGVWKVCGCWGEQNLTACSLVGRKTPTTPKARTGNESDMLT